MIAFERRKKILELLRLRPGMRVGELADSLGVSEGTVRNDFHSLEGDGKLKRVRGGAVLDAIPEWQVPPFSYRIESLVESKQIIARAAAEVVEDGDSLWLDASTTVFWISYYLQNRSKLRIVTNGIEVARAMAVDPGNTVILLGGILDADGFSVRGPIALENLNDLRVSKAFISCSGITPEEGLTEVDLFESQLKKAVVQTAGQVYALVDSHKFGKVDLAPFVHLERLTHLFTDCGLSAEWEDRLKQTGLDFTVCERVFASEPPANTTGSHR